MTRAVEDLEKELLALPHDERARLAHELLVSLHEEEERLSPEEWQAAWDEEIKRRLGELERGEVELVPMDEAFQSVREMLSKARSTR